MHSQIISTVYVFVTSIILLVTISSSFISTTAASPMVVKDVNTPPPLCEPGIVEDMPQHIKKVCIALENSNQLSNALNAYIRNEAAALLYRGEDLVAAPGTGKRTDVDHVFLRFGRRR